MGRPLTRRVYEVGDARVVVDNISLQLIRGATLDWQSSLRGSSFAILNNPNAVGGCGCGSSFVSK